MLCVNVNVHSVYSANVHDLPIGTENWTNEEAT